MQIQLVSHIMTSAVLSVEFHEPITEVMRLFASYPIHHLPVVNKTRLVGMLSTADMLKLEYFMPKTTTPASNAVLNDRFRVEKLMRTPVITATPVDSIEDAASRMSSKGIHALPVINEANHLIGIITTTDIMQALLRASVDQPLSSAVEVTPPSEHRLGHALETARAALLNGNDAAGVAACALYLYERNQLLDALRHDVVRYLRGGQDESLHANLIKDIERLEQQQHAALALRL